MESKDFLFSEGEWPVGIWREEEEVMGRTGQITITNQLLQVHTIWKVLKSNGLRGLFRCLWWLMLLFLLWWCISITVLRTIWESKGAVWLSFLAGFLFSLWKKTLSLVLLLIRKSHRRISKFDVFLFCWF